MTLAGQAPAAQEHSAAPFSMRRIGNTDHGNNDADIYEVVSAKGRVLVPSVRKCDAMLFRAAPDVVAALIGLLDSIDNMDHLMDDRSDWDAAVQDARAAIARATGAAK